VVIYIIVLPTIRLSWNDENKKPLGGPRTRWGDHKREHTQARHRHRSVYGWAEKNGESFVIRQTNSLSIVLPNPQW